ncbi:uncharacterized protein I206_107249 [Kwoniella pini CBS 10737]|uniref:Uncharacterized protein n=1 Tax=Kwoniella pini CBS 10737 TaxID=1296096 RepID=A0A1B9HYV9_9TREE|nr:uncharacterized protein I206_05206 [Kwoniella pini CBS 10737]OCF48428.1 hypothetical protein I206_05206 [Kwoniella pini CBS 10737]
MSQQSEKEEPLQKLCRRLADIGMTNTIGHDAQSRPGPMSGDCSVCSSTKKKVSQADEASGLDEEDCEKARQYIWGSAAVPHWESDESVDEDALFNEDKSVHASDSNDAGGSDTERESINNNGKRVRGD